VFWTTGCAQFKRGQNKEKVAEYIKSLTYDKQIWKDSIVGTKSGHPCRPQVHLCGLESQQAGVDANQTFSMSILPWRSWSGWPVANAHGA
jgi:hypothetical protein